MKLSDLIKDNPAISASVAETAIRSIHYRAQDVQPNGVFVAVKGFAADGHDFIAEAAARGAAAIVVQRSDLPARIEKSVVIPVRNSRRALSKIAARFYQNPSRKLVIIGVTGTNGKTTTSYLIENILQNAGFNVGVIGTVNYRFAGNTFPNPMTTPESLDLHRILSEMAESGITHVVMEVSSHAIDQDRIAHCEFDVGVFTNLSQDHLDYHQTMDAYWLCKKRFFTEILPSASKTKTVSAVINCDDFRGRSIKDDLPFLKVSTGLSTTSMIHPENVRLELSGISGSIRTPQKRFHFKSKLVGRYNLENILSAVGAAVTLGIPLRAIQSGLEAFSGVPGRLEPVFNDRRRFVFVDYAHTPDALANVLATLKENSDISAASSGKMICVFGCGGDRDQSKRPQMGEIAQRFSDLAVITSDNPRTESPLRIIEHILDGMKTSAVLRYSSQDLRQGITQKGYLVETDRKKAIQLAVQASAPGDIILIAGKGHEDYQIIGSRKIPFDDRIEAQQAIAAAAI